jgi:hypothetical protein
LSITIEQARTVAIIAASAVAAEIRNMITTAAV